MKEKEREIYLSCFICWTNVYAAENTYIDE